MQRARYIELVNKFHSRRVVVVGDIMVDQYIWGKVSRISPEAPVPVVNVEKEDLRLGGAANVANNLSSLGCRCHICGVVGKDQIGEELIKMLTKRDINCDAIFYEKRPTTLKTRIIAHSQHVVRLDKETVDPISSYVKEKIFSYLNGSIKGFDAVIISDYGKGVVDKELVETLVSLCKKEDVYLAIDPNIKNFSLYREVNLITPNHFEASTFLGDPSKSLPVEKVGVEIMRRLECSSLLITRGEEGMSLFEEGQIHHIPTVAKEVYDVTGAGDTVISAFVLAKVSGATSLEAAIISNAAAGVVVGEIGTSPITERKLVRALSDGRF